MCFLWHAAAAGSGGAAAGALSAEDERYMERYGRLRGILGGATPITLHLEFLYSHNHADLQACGACPAQPAAHASIGLNDPCITLCLRPACALSCCGAK